GKCVRCLADADCGKNAHCTDDACVPFKPCVNSLDCAGGTNSICDRSRGECVGCVADGDCGKDAACVDHTCTPKCKSDKDCTSAGQLCDRTAGVCVQCLEAVDCPAVYHCSRGKCELDTCETGRAECSPDKRVMLVCNAAGSGETPIPCSDG